jgi:hypothetical protein
MRSCTTGAAAAELLLEPLLELLELLELLLAAGGALELLLELELDIFYVFTFQDSGVGYNNICTWPVRTSDVVKRQKLQRPSLIKVTNYYIS